MLQHYILIAVRHLQKHKGFAALNIFCLATGITFCLLIGQYVMHEKNINHGLRNFHQQYFVNSEWKNATGMGITTTGPLAKALTTNYPTLVAGYYRMNPFTNVVSAGDKHFKEDMAISDTTLVTRYGFPMVYGDPHHAFINSKSAVITSTLARKLFGTDNVIGRTITVANFTPDNTDYKVSAVLEDMPVNTVNNYIDKKGYSVFIPFEGNHTYSAAGAGEDRWTEFTTVSFIELQPGVSPSALDKPVKQLLATNVAKDRREALTVKFIPLDRYYLDADNGAVNNTLRILSFVALGILILAVVNFINLMLGTSLYRVREIGLRKVFGSRRPQLVLQYLSESVLLTIAAALLSLCFYGLSRPLFQQIWETQLPGILEMTAAQYGMLALLTLVVGVIAGLYPALKLSAVAAAESVKGLVTAGDKGGWLRKSLVVLQFSLAIGVFIFSITLSKQVKLIFERDLGFNRDQMMLINAFPKQWDSVGVAKMEFVARALEQVPQVKAATLSFEIPEPNPYQVAKIMSTGAPANQAFTVGTLAADDHYLRTYGLKLVEGRFFHDGEGGFTPAEVVLTESTVKALHWKTAVGKTIDYATGGTADVVGVVKDFTFSATDSPTDPPPVVIVNIRDWVAYRYISVKLQGGHLAEGIAAVRDKWKSVSPTAPFEYIFADEKFASLYARELRLQKAGTVTTILMAIIVFLGIIGLLALALAQRAKEMAIRKVLGAEVLHIVGLFIRQYAVLIGVALVIACPLAFIASSKWLEQYVYRVSQDAGTYLLVGAVTAGTAFALIALQCLKTAMANPVRALKNE